MCSSTRALLGSHHCQLTARNCRAVPLLRHGSGIGQPMRLSLRSMLAMCKATCWTDMSSLNAGTVVCNPHQTPISQALSMRQDKFLLITQLSSHRILPLTTGQLCGNAYIYLPYKASACSILQVQRAASPAARAASRWRPRRTPRQRPWAPVRLRHLT